MSSYTYATLQADINSKIKGKIGILTDARSLINGAVRQVMADIDLLTTRKKTTIVPNLVDGIAEYTCPDDMKGYSIVTIGSPTVTDLRRQWTLVPYEQFLRRQDNNTLTISDANLARKILVNTTVEADEASDLIYYSNYGWRTNAVPAVWIENSTANTDILNAGSEEYELILAKATELAADDVDEEKVSEKQAKRYAELKKIYINNNPSEALVMIMTGVDFVVL